MAVTGKVYAEVFDQAFDKEIDITADTHKVALTTSTHTLDQDAHDYYNDLTNEVPNGNGYTTGGATLGSPTFAYTSGTNTWAHDGTDVSWTTATFTARHAHEYDSTPGTGATNPLMSYQDFGGDFSVSAGTFTIAWNAAGLWTISVS